MCAHFRSRAVISSHLLTKIGTGSCAIVVCALFFRARDPISAIIAVLCALLALFLSLKLIERRQIDALKSEVPAFLDRWILNMKLGNALSSARTAALLELSTRSRALLEPLFLKQGPAARAHLILDEKILREVIELSHSPHSAIQRLENAREWMRKSDEFRRKSVQAVRQTSIQAAVLLILLIALAIFTVQRHGWRRNSDLVTASFVLSGLGIFTMRHLARKKRWKI
jgi:Flp pilus assembly protein TadB